MAILLSPSRPRTTPPLLALTILLLAVMSITVETLLWSMSIRPDPEDTRCRRRLNIYIKGKETNTTLLTTIDVGTVSAC